MQGSLAAETIFELCKTEKRCHAKRNKSSTNMRIVNLLKKERSLRAISTLPKLKTGEVSSFLGQTSKFRPVRSRQCPSYKFMEIPKWAI